MADDGCYLQRIARGRDECTSWLEDMKIVGSNLIDSKAREEAMIMQSFACWQGRDVTNFTQWS